MVTRLQAGGPFHDSICSSRWPTSTYRWRRYKIAVAQHAAFAAGGPANSSKNTLVTVTRVRLMNHTSPDCPWATQESATAEQHSPHRGRTSRPSQQHGRRARPRRALRARREEQPVRRVALRCIPSGVWEGFEEISLGLMAYPAVERSRGTVVCQVTEGRVHVPVTRVPGDLPAGAKPGLVEP